MRSGGAVRYVDPRASRGPVYRWFARFSASRFGFWLSRNISWKIDPYLLRLTRGANRDGADHPHRAAGNAWGAVGAASSQRGHLFPRRREGNDRRLEGRRSRKPRLVLQRPGQSGRPVRRPTVPRPGGRRRDRAGADLGARRPGIPALRRLSRARRPQRAHDPDPAADPQLDQLALSAAGRCCSGGPYRDLARRCSSRSPGRRRAGRGRGRHRGGRCRGRRGSRLGLGP